MSDTFDVTWGLSVTKKGVTKLGIPLFVELMNTTYGTKEIPPGCEVSVTLPVGENHPGLKEIPQYASGRTTHHDSQDNCKYRETMEAMVWCGWDHRQAADRLGVGYDTIRSRLYAYLRKKLVRKVAQDKWGSIYG